MSWQGFPQACLRLLSEEREGVFRDVSELLFPRGRVLEAIDQISGAAFRRGECDSASAICVRHGATRSCVAGRGWESFES